MSEGEPSNLQSERSSGVVPFRTPAKTTSSPVAPATPTSSSSHIPAPPPRVAFHRTELAHVLNLYGRKVAQGEWRDYAIDMLKDRAVFSIFRRASEVPIYRIEKDPKLARKQGAYSVISATGQVLRRGRELPQVLKVLDRQRKFEVVD